MNKISYVACVCYKRRSITLCSLHQGRRNEIFRETISVIAENNDLFFGIYYFFAKHINKGTLTILLLFICMRSHV